MQRKPKQILPRFLFSICRLALKDLDTSVQFPQPLCACRRGFHLANSAKRSQGGSILHVQIDASVSLRTIASLLGTANNTIRTPPLAVDFICALRHFLASKDKLHACSF